MIQGGRHRASRPRLSVVVIATVVGLLALAVTFYLKASQSGRAAAVRPPASPSPTPSDTATTVDTSAPADRSATTMPFFGAAQTPSAAPNHAVAASPPVRLIIPSIAVDAPLQPLGLLSDGTLQSPTKWDVPGWYAGGVYPGQVGPAVIAGHIDSTSGPAVFFRLRELAVGARVAITERSGTKLTFVVDGVQSFPKKSFPSEAVYGPTPYPELRLITCTGDFDQTHHNYLSNLIVSAHLA